MRFALPAIRHGRPGFRALADLWAGAEHLLFDDIEIDMGQVNWFDADMCAAFGAILYRLGSNTNAIRLVNIQPGVGNILSRNGFLGHYGRENIPDHRGTTLPYQDGVKVVATSHVIPAGNAGTQGQGWQK
uniref:STAS domain-containing protein n=1 Tax=Candidatus Kentrum sp. FW TaxID=2126338 RepID=A0A450TTJ2_9GAMM|nr:MAG: hypothetical protein BECKFW1821C_GA0114237_10306 [Candidatus Kentron sp. FW]